MKRIVFALIIVFTVCVLHSQTRIKDISKVRGADNKQVIGYGLVVGLQGTGDSPASAVTIQSINNMLEHFGLSVPSNRIRPNNTAAVMVTGLLPPFATSGAAFDIVVSSVGDARSLEGGTLLMTPLIGENNQKYAIAQGPISMGGNVDNGRDTRVRKSYSNAGRIPNGAIVETENPNMFVRDGELQLQLYNADFTTAERVAAAINAAQGMRLATADNGSNVSVIVPDNVIVNNEVIAFISNIENLVVQPQQAARVVINERTGTVIAGGNVQIAQVAISHGNLTLQIQGPTQEYTTGPFTLVVPVTSNVDAENARNQRVYVVETATVQDLATALNAIRVTPRDMISIFQALKEAGALLADLKII